VATFVQCAHQLDARGDHGQRQHRQRVVAGRVQQQEAAVQATW